MKIALDAMGGDFAPSATVEGAVIAARELSIPVILVGDSERIELELKKYSTHDLPISIKHTTQVVGMEESPAQAIRKKKDSSLRVCFDLMKSGEASAVVSAGNSGAAMAAGMFLLGRKEGIDRPAIAVTIPTLKDPAIVLDVGGNVDCKPVHLTQFAIMGEVYAKYVLKKDNPKIGLLSNGEEDGKGNEVTKITNEILKQTNLNYYGNIEGKDINKGDIDVVVCDGFVGNVVLKLTEGVLMAAREMMKREVMKSWICKFGFFLALPALKRFKKDVDYSEYGGAPLLGVKGNVIISHGSSNSKAIKNAILRAKEYTEGRVNAHLEEELKRQGDLQKISEKIVIATGDSNG